MLVLRRPRRSVRRLYGERTNFSQSYKIRPTHRPIYTDKYYIYIRLGNRRRNCYYRGYRYYGMYACL